MTGLGQAVRNVPFLSRVLALLTARRVVIRGRSMYPCLAPGEYVLFDRLAYRGRGPGPGDVVLAAHPTEGGRPLVKRVVGLPGDRVETAAGRLLINGKPLGESDQEPPGALVPDRQWLLGEGEYFLVGDALSVSTDSRTFGPVARKAIRAKAWLVYWPSSRWRRVV